MIKQYDVYLRVVGSVSVIAAYFIVLHVNILLGVVIHFIADLISIPYFIRTKSWDVVIMLTFLLAIKPQQISIMTTIENKIYRLQAYVDALEIQRERMRRDEERIVSMMREILQQQTSSESVLLPAQQGEGAVMITSVTKQTSAQGNDRQDHP